MKPLNTNLERLVPAEVLRSAAVGSVALALKYMNKAPNRKIIALAIALTTTFCLVGCGSLPNAFESSYPTFQETQSSWPKQSPNAGRIVVYWPALQGQGLLQAPVSEILTIDNDKSKITSIASGMFVFADISPGTHTFEIKPRGWLANKEILPVTVSAGEIIYLKTFEPSQESTNRPAFSISIPRYQFKIVPESEALAALMNLRHEYGKPLPFPEQKGRPAM